MSGFLHRVAASKKAEVAGKRARLPGRELERRAAAVPLRDFRGAVGSGSRIIAEIKKRSPSVEAFPHASDPVRLATIYEANGAAAISIVTDAPNFGTSLGDVGPVREAVDLPVLVKDFVIDPYQVVEARAAGADALLLIARLLSAEELASLLDRVGKLGMAALVECHDEDDIARAVGAGAALIGVNNRDLGTLTVSLDITRRLVPLVPEGSLCISESGIGSRDQVEELARAGATAFLIGTSILASPDPGAKLKELAFPLLGRPCGSDGGAENRSGASSGPGGSR